MTFEQKAKQIMYERGLFPHMADIVFQNMQTDKANEAMRGLWNDNIEDYPAIFTGILLRSTCISALEYIDTNMLKAWFRPAFVLKE